MQLDHAACERARLARDVRYDGRFFIAVTSTKIYCRPICPAPTAQAKNVRYYPSAAAAAEDGFRPCLRCRPEASPGTPAWEGAASTVTRGLKLIAESALDEAGVDQLAERLGMGSRHLRRLFLKHLGATPIAVAQTRRVHFAKKLIDESNLSMTEVALASGFNSVRRFNATFQNLYGRAPSELRRLSRGLSRGMREPGERGRYRFRLDYRPPLDWASLVDFLESRAIPGVESVMAGEYRRNISLQGESGSIAVRQVRGKSWLELDIQFPDPRALLRIVERVRRIFDLQADPAQVERQFLRNSTLAPLLRAYPGLRVPGCWDGFELAIRAILGQQVSVKGASTLAGRIAKDFGKPVPGGFLFPDARTLAEADLRAIHLTQKRASAIGELARAVVQGSVILDGSLSAAELEEQMIAIPGIGPWTAQYVAMRLGEPDAFPSGDLYLLEHAAASAEWRPWRAYAAMYLWKGAAGKLAASKTVSTSN
jgi:AraC family transcriptional regulator of adaptative response / DNA-3-methyladenine glycosylase II